MVNGEVERCDCEDEVDCRCEEEQANGSIRVEDEGIRQCSEIVLKVASNCNPLLYLDTVGIKFSGDLADAPVEKFNFLAFNYTCIRIQIKIPLNQSDCRNAFRLIPYDNRLKSYDARLTFCDGSAPIDYGITVMMGTKPISLFGASVSDDGYNLIITVDFVVLTLGSENPFADKHGGFTLTFGQQIPLGYVQSNKNINCLNCKHITSHITIGGAGIKAGSLLADVADEAALEELARAHPEAFVISLAAGAEQVVVTPYPAASPRDRVPATIEFLKTKYCELRDKPQAQEVIRKVLAQLGVSSIRCLGTK